MKAKREYSSDVLRIFGNTIIATEKMVQEFSHTGEDRPHYEIILDPEEFLDLCAGKYTACYKPQSTL